MHRKPLLKFKFTMNIAEKDENVQQSLNKLELYF